MLLIKVLQKYQKQLIVNKILQVINNQHNKVLFSCLIQKNPPDLSFPKLLKPGG